MAKTLPIQLVKTRKNQDEFLKEAGGSNDLQMGYRTSHSREFSSTCQCAR